MFSQVRFALFSAPSKSQFIYYAQHTPSIRPAYAQHEWKCSNKSSAAHENAKISNAIICINSEKSLLNFPRLWQNNFPMDEKDIDININKLREQIFVNYLCRLLMLSSDFHQFIMLIFFLTLLLASFYATFIYKLNI
jgi:hypothetical protein